LKAQGAVTIQRTPFFRVPAPSSDRQSLSARPSKRATRLRKSRRTRLCRKRARTGIKNLHVFRTGVLRKFLLTIHARIQTKNGAFFSPLSLASDTVVPSDLGKAFFGLFLDIVRFLSSRWANAHPRGGWGPRTCCIFGNLVLRYKLHKENIARTGQRHWRCFPCILSRWQVVGVRQL